MHKSKKALSLLLSLALVFTIVSPAFAFSFQPIPGTPEDTDSGDYFGGFNEWSDYSIVVSPAVTAVNQVISPVIKIYNNKTQKYVTGNDLEDFWKNLELLADPGVLIYDSNDNGRFDERDYSVTKVTYEGYYYYDGFNPVLGDPSVRFTLSVNDDMSGFVIQSATTDVFTSKLVRFLVAKPGKISVKISGGTVNIDGSTKTVQDAKIYFTGTQVQVFYASGNKNTLATYPETAIIGVPYANFNTDDTAYAVIEEDGKYYATVQLESNELIDLDRSGVYQGYKVVLPPLAADKKYTLKVYARVSSWTSGNNYDYYAVGNVNLTVDEGKSTLIKPEDKVLAAGLYDPVTFTLDNKLADPSKHNVVDFKKYVRFIVAGKPYNVSETTGNLVEVDTSIINNQTWYWYEVTDKGLRKVKEDSRLPNGYKVTFGSPISDTVKVNEGKEEITVNANVPKDKTLLVEAAYTNYTALFGENRPYDSVSGGVAVGPRNKGNWIGFQKDYTKVFKAVELEAKPGTLTANTDSIYANQYHNVEFTLKDVHGKGVKGKMLNFSMPVVSVGGSSFGSSGNVTTSVETQDEGKVTATLFSQYANALQVDATIPIEQPVTINVKPSQQTGTKVQFVIGSDKYWVNGKEFTMEGFQGTSPAPYIAPGDRTVVPASYIALGLNAQVFWDANTKTATFVRGDTTVQMKVGSKIVKITKGGNTFTQSMEAAATTMDANGMDAGRIFVPAKYVVNAFGYEAKWDAETKTVTIE
ncbi:MAG: hypothetical protein BSOLF_0866 [Candidatus Carbobacillus altaicus]|uniref:Copper amine oxidase-like N-terminal domain-containing protein n=1 Tax=Candidatus Carbonibacillus altaicus TaxID=2163959 RepID=A0A2R6Y098_9BACL|nr:MAG: hypothetical protein BSOLF_0866 [Candidatus Carbobacillus altaicus]